MAAVARAEPRFRARGARTRARPTHINPLRSGVAWIVVLAVLLGGVVALQVAVLQLNVRMDELARERASLRADNARIESRLASAASAPRIQMLARKRLGLVPAPPRATTYIELVER